MSNRISRALEVPSRAWCKLMHSEAMWPVAGYYRCRTCLRQYPVSWEVQPTAPTPVVKTMNVPALQPELLSLLHSAATERAA
jgi:hypothetical protein